MGQYHSRIGQALFLRCLLNTNASETQRNRRARCRRFATDGWAIHVYPPGDKGNEVPSPLRLREVLLQKHLDLLESLLKLLAGQIRTIIVLTKRGCGCFFLYVAEPLGEVGWTHPDPQFSALVPARGPAYIRNRVRFAGGATLTDAPCGCTGKPDSSDILTKRSN